MPLIRVTVTLPPHLVKRADRLARQHKASRSAVLAEALRAHLGEPEEGAIRRGLVAEPGWGTYVGGRSAGAPAWSDEGLLAELRRRLGAPVAAAVEVGSDGVPVEGTRIRYDRGKLAKLCRRHQVRRLSLFGSVLTDAFGPDSDVDVLVEFEPGHTPGLGITDIEDELSALFGGRRVDVVTERSLHRLLRDHVLASAVVQFAA